MKIYHNGRYVKNVPAEFAKIPDLPDYFEDIDSPRLSNLERRILKMALFHTSIQEFLETSKLVKVDDFVRVNKSSPHFAHEVKSDDGQIWYSLLFFNGHAIRITRKIYKLCPNKQSVRYPNSFVVPSPAEQMKLF